MTPRPIVRAAGALALALAGMAAQAASYTFVQTGFEGGGTVSGSFSGNDLDGDGWLFGYELSAFTLSFSGNAQVAAFTHTKANLGGIGWFIGDAFIGGRNDNYLQTSRTSQGRSVQYDAWGWPEFSIPGRITDSASGKVITTGEMVRVSPVPEPEAWALWLGGLGCIGRLVRRRQLP